MKKKKVLKNGYCIMSYTDEEVLIKIEYYNKKGELHCEDGPAIIHYNNSIKSIEEYYIKGKIKDGISKISYFSNGEKRETLCYKNGMIHNKTGPAFIKYNKDGSILEKQYWIENKLCIKDFKIVKIDGINFLVK